MPCTVSAANWCRGRAGRLWITRKGNTVPRGTMGVEKPTRHRVTRYLRGQNTV